MQSTAKFAPLIAALAAVLTVGLFAKAAADDGKTTTALEAAHAHNDYWHERPLLDALDHGFCSVEADVFLVDGALLVGHDRSELRPERTLEALYLEPLRRRVAENAGRIHPGGPEFTLLVDIKSDGEETYRALAKLLAKYADIVTSVENGQVTQRAVRVIVSGNRARSIIAADSPRFAGIDGRIGDLDSDLPAHLLPLISDNWRLHFRWRGEGPMPDAERNKLHDIVQQAHDRNRRVRFWATPENENLWRELQRAGVDLVNTDELSRLERFLRKGQRKPQP